MLSHSQIRSGSLFFCHYLWDTDLMSFELLLTQFATVGYHLCFHEDPPLREPIVFDLSLFFAVLTLPVPKS